MQKYVTLMSTYGKQVGIDFDFYGTEELGPDVADTIFNSLYTQYFTQRAHPSAPETLLEAAKAAGIDHNAAETFVHDEYERLQGTKMLLREQASNGMDSPSPASSEVIEVGTEIELSRRAFWNISALGPGWTGHIIYSSAIYPYLIGAQILGGFYQKIMRSVSGIWSSTPETNSYMMSFGTIRLWICADVDGDAARVRGAL
ncbi:MAG: hypothetical protein Q9210_002883 [Variospora velana]